jgi:hypothetical protein
VRFPELAASVRRVLGDNLRSLTLFGSCLSEQTERAGSIPDLFAVVDRLDPALKATGVGPLARAVAPWLPPATVAFQGEAKLNLIEAPTLERELRLRRDLCLTGRLGKRTLLLHARDAECAGELEAAQQAAQLATAELVLLAQPRSVTLGALLLRCVGLSYLSEIRPERPAKIAALYEAFADWYRTTYSTLLLARARSLGLAVSGETLVDARPDAERAVERRTLGVLLWRSRVRSVARWPKQALMYRGALAYVVGKLQRAWREPQHRDLHRPLG